MSLISIEHIFGIESCSSNCLFYLNEDSFIYPSIRHLIISKLDDQSQHFIPYENQHDLFTVSPNKEYLAIVDKNRVIVYDLQSSQRRKKILSLKEKFSSNEILSLAFSSNSKSLLVLHGSLDHLLVCWSIDRLKPVSIQPVAIDVSHHPLHLQVSFNPTDSSQILITGNEIFQPFRLNNGKYSPCVQRCESMNIICHCWLNGSNILLGIEGGFMYTINQHGDILQRYDISPHSPTNSNENSLNRQIPSDDILCLLPFSRGVFVSTRKGHVLMYERNENSSNLTYLRKLMLPGKSPEMIFSLALSSNEETLLAATDHNRLYRYAFSKKEGNRFTLALDGAHSGSIRAAAVCLRKANLFSIGQDRCLKIWNLQTNHQELSHQFVDEPLAISVHPTGIFICVSFWNTVEIFIYTIDGLIRFKQFQMNNITIIEYSHQGHILAIAYENILQLHCHYDYDQMTHGRANKKKFRLIRWSDDDTLLLTVDFDDLIIQWDPSTGQRLAEYRLVGFNVEDLLISADNKVAYLLTSDKRIKEFRLMTSIHDLNISFPDHFIPTSFLLNNPSQHLFIGSDNGSIYSIKLSQSNPSIDLLQTNVHRGSITKLLISSKNDLLISMGDDGNIILYHRNKSQVNEESKLIFRDEILVNENLLQEQNIEFNDLIKREFEIGHEYENKIESKEEEYIEHLRQLNLHCQSNLNTMQNKLTELHQQRSQLNDEQKQQLNQLIDQREHSIEQFVREKINHYEELLYRDRFLQSEISNFRSSETEQRHFNQDLFQRNIQLIHLSYQEKLNSIKNTFDQKHSNINERISYLEEMKEIFDDQTQLELTNLNESYQMKLKTLLTQIDQLQNEEILLKLRLKQLDEESNHYQNQIEQFQTERNQFLNQIRQVNNDLDLTKQTIQQRNFIIQEKIKRTNEMENRRDELEKFAYVFNYKILELTNQIGPRQYEVQALIQQFNNMDHEYDLLNKNNDKYFIQISDSKARLRAIDKDLRHELFSIRKLNETMANLKEDLKLCCQSVDQPKRLIKIIRNIYSKYFLQISRNSQLNFFDSDRQRTYFERTNQRLQYKINSDIQNEQKQQIRNIREQMNMMREISSYCLKVVQVERILSDLDIVFNIVEKRNFTSTNQIVEVLKIEQGSDFIQQKQMELNSISTKQQERIERLRDLIEQFQKQFQ